MIRIICLSALLTLLTAAYAHADESADTISGQNLREVVVTGNSARQRVNDTRIGAQRLELSTLSALPSFGGEKDIIKSLALLPGVRSEGDGGGGFEVRGGNSYQNLVVLDGITLYNPSHVMGIFSTFNDNALGSATLYKGPFPAVYGGASSSVLDTSLAPGDMENYHGSATIGILAAKVEADGPIVKNKLSAAVAARRSYVDAFLKMVPQYRSTVMNFYDLSAKLRFRPNATHLVDAGFFMSRDNMAVDDLMGFYWGNLGASLNWVARGGDRLTFTTLASMTRFTPKMSMDIMNMDQTLLTYIHNYSLSEKIALRLADNHNIEFGLRSQLLKVKSAEWLVNNSREIEIRSLWENALWLDYTGKFADRLEIVAGARLNSASALSQPRFHEFVALNGTPAQFAPKTYIDAEPRLSLKYLLKPDHSLRAGFGLASQNLHALRLNNTSFPSDRFALTSAYVKPERATQWGLGYNGMTPDGSYDWSAEAYFRGLRNVYDFKDGRSTLSVVAVEIIILGG
ncbi:MAG: TonB-dependent receptor [Paramuribaculum sp.]|nr:TonB-dependent receptor [Paramuribaculum sp.]